MQTRVYIDGYNFYYGCLKNTPYKWLDLGHLFQHYLLPRSLITSSQLHPHFGIKFYTAEISEKVAEDPTTMLFDKDGVRAVLSHAKAFRDFKRA